MTDKIRKAVETVVEKFKKDEAQGYRSRDRQYAIEILSSALSSPSSYDEGIEAAAKDASERAAKNAGIAPQLLYADILWALQDHSRSFLGTTGGERGSIVAWQTMDSAPKDGTEIDLWEPHQRLTDCHWHRGQWLKWGGDPEIGWLVVGTDATHWMPPPAPPPADAIERGEHITPGAGG